MKYLSYLILTAFTIVATTSASAAQPVTPSQAARQVDRLLVVETIGQSSSAKLAKSASDDVFLRRAFLDVLGVPPTPNDVLAFALEDSKNKRGELVAKLLKNNRFGVNWSRYWRDVIMYRRSEPRALFAQRSLQTFLQEKLNDNTKWSEIATSFITAMGDVREEGATALIMAQAGRPEETVAEISRIFMGIQIQCAQCHDHPTDRWKRKQFHQLAAFFPRTAIRPRRMGTQRTFLVVADDYPRFRRRRNNNNRYRGTLEHYMPDLKNPTSQGTKTQPIFFVTGQKLEYGVKDKDRRATLAKWLSARSNPWFAKAMVNRMWAELCGEGFYEPVDDMGPDRQCSAPKTMDYLSTAFVDSGYDVKWLFQTIMETKAYQRQSKPRRNAEGIPFAANCSQRLRGDQILDSLTAVLDLPSTIGGRARRRGRGGPRFVFNSTFGFDPSTSRDEVKGSIPQALFLMNSPIVNRAINARRPGGLGLLLRQIRNDSELVTELYLKVFAREPSKSEMRTCLSYVREVKNRNEAFEDILWALVNSTEFVYRR